MQGYKELDHTEWRYLLTGYGGEIVKKDCPVDWINENAWNEMYKNFFGLNLVGSYKGIMDDFFDHLDEWRHIYDSNEPQDEKLPRGWDEKLNAFQKINIINGIRQDKV